LGVRRSWLGARVVGVLVVGLAFLAACYPPVPPGEDLASRWANTLTGPSSEDEIDGVAAAPDGSVFVTGKFEQATTIGGVTLTSAGHADIPLARFSPFGAPLWVNRYGGPGEDNLFDVDADADGAIGTGWFEGTVDFGSVWAVSAGMSDCVIVAVNNDGSTRWVRRLGGPYRDGCNEVSIAADGSIVTSIDTEGGWTPPGLAPIPRLTRSDTLLVRLAPDGHTLWMRHVGGVGPQRGKSMAVAPDGSIVFGGDSYGPLTAGGTTWPVPGGGRDAWMSRWTPDGTLQWLKTWGGPGDDLVKGLAETNESIYAVGTFTGTIDIDGVTLDAGSAADLAVVRFEPDGGLGWATSVTANGALGGAEIVTAPDGGVLFAGTTATGIQFRPATGAPVPLDDEHGGIGWLAHYRPNGSVGFATTIGGTADGRPGEIARTGQRVYLDVALRGNENAVNGTPLPPAQRKDGSVWALDLATIS